MIDPTIFTINIGNWSFSLYWYGVLVMLGVALAAWIGALGFKKHGQDADYIWDSLLWVLPAGIIGARLWYVVNESLGGDLRYIQDPISILNLRQGGLHYFGAILFGAIAFYIYAKKMGLDMWLALDSVAPGLLLAQAVARPANFINQELYGQPTNLPWGIKIDRFHRITPYDDLLAYPEEITRFHPTFAYEIIWNVFAAALLFLLGRMYKDKMRPGTIFGAWLILAGVGRNIIEFFRPDQPTFSGTNFSYSRLIAILMVLAGLLILLVKYRVIKIGFLKAGEENYKIALPLEERLKAKNAHKKNDLNNNQDKQDTEKPGNHS